MKGFEGNFRSVDADNDGFYEPNQNCTWTLTTMGYRRFIELNISAIDIQPDDSCRYDFLKACILNQLEFLRITAILTNYKKLSEYDQEIPKSHTADQPTALCGRATNGYQKQDTRKTK